MGTLGRLGVSIIAPEQATDIRLRRWPLPEWARVAANTVFLLFAFLIVRHFAMTACRLPEAALTQRSILGACAAGNGRNLSAVLGFYLLIVLAVPALRQGWNELEGGRWLRLLIGALTMVLAWSGTVYAYNFWYEQGHLADRLTLGLLAALVWWRPVFVFPFVLVDWAVLWQFDFPALGFRALVAEFRPVLQVLSAFVAVFLVQRVSRQRSMHGFLFLALCLVAADFWVPAWAKVTIGWLSHGHLYYLLPNAYTHGWLGFVAPDTIAAVARALEPLDWPMRIATILVEAGALFIFANERSAYTLLVAFTLLLGMFFATIGYFFWKWMVLQVGLLLVVFRTPASAVWRRQLFTRARFVVSVPVIATASYWAAPAALAWFDTPLTNALHFEAVGERGTVYDLPAAFFAPYESHIAMGLFVGSLTSMPVLAASYGVTSVRSTADALLTAQTPDDIVRLEQAARHGDAATDQRFVQMFESFVRRRAAVANRRRGALSWLARFEPPSFLWTFSKGHNYDGREPIAVVRVYRVSSLFDGRRYELFRRELVSTVLIPPQNNSQ